MPEAYTRCPYPLEVQSLIFSKNEFDLPEAMEWMEKNKVRRRPIEMLETGQSYRARMHQPTEFVAGSFRTIRLGRGQSRVQAVVGCPKKHVRAAILSERAARKSGQASPPPATRISVRPTGKAAQSDIARRLVASPPAPGMSFRQWAKREGIDISRGTRRAWKDRRR